LVIDGSRTIMSLLANSNGRRLGLLAVLAWAMLAGPAMAEVQPFDVWLEELRQDALKEGIRAETVTATLTGLTPIERVIELDRRQPEGRFTFQQYNERVLSASRIERGRVLYREHRELLDRVAADYGVQPRFIVALWGIESSYGSYHGDYPVIGALATLAYDGRRASFFRGELLKALRIVDRGDIAVERLTGSWAGAMGQSQFMPSSYHAYAIDYDGDGRRDIWTSLPDVFASIANYLAKAGWNDRYTWGRKVRLPAPLNGELIGLQTTKPLPQWQELGVRRTDGANLPAVSLNASLLSTDEGQGPAYLVYDNFRVLMAWNRSTYFALTVGELADLIARG
jgi:membrane-bound lytic murein transglycosylase B